ASAKAQAKKALDEATARATAIHDGAERRLNLLSTRHADTIKRLTDILDGVSSLVAAETARMSLEDEVDQATTKAIAAAESASAARPPASAAGAGGPAGWGGPAGASGPAVAKAPAGPNSAGGAPRSAAPSPASTAPSRPASAAATQSSPPAAS